MTTENQARQQIEKVFFDGQTLVSFPIDVAIKYSRKIHSGFYVPLTKTKNIKIELDGDLNEKLSSYKTKGLKHILFAEEDYNLFLKVIKKGLTDFFYKDGEESKKLDLAKILLLVKKSSLFIGLNEELITQSEALVEQTVAFIKTSTHLAPLYKSFLKDNQEELIINIYKSYIGVSLAHALNWPPHLFEKIIQVCLLSDLCLTEDDYSSFYMVKDFPERWTANYREHPTTMTKILQSHHSRSFGREVIKAIEQHEEHPLGKGFPHGIKGAGIESLSSIVITAKLFVSKLLESEFAYDKRKEFVDDLIANEIESNNFKAPCRGLYTMMGFSEDGGPLEAEESSEAVEE